MVVSRDEVRPKRDGLLEPGYGFLVSAEIVEDRPTGAPKLGILWLEDERLIQPRQSLGAATETAKHDGIVMQGRRIGLRPCSNRLAQAAFRFRGLAESKQHDAQEIESA